MDFFQDLIYQLTDFFVGQLDQAVQILTNHFKKVGVFRTDALAGVFKPLAFVVAGKKPVFFTLALVNRPGRTQRISATAANGDTTENAFPYMVVLTVVTAAFSQVCLCLVKGHLINERFVRVGRYDPILLGNGNLFAGLDACLAGFPKQRIAKINLILDDPLYRGVIPAIRGAGGTCVGKVVAV